MEQKELALFVACDGDDSAAGDFASPLKSLEAAIERVRAKRSDNPSHTARITLRGGRHVLQRTLQLTSDDSHLTICAQSGETVIVSGGQSLRGWEVTTLNGRQVWRAALPQALRGRTIRSFFMNDRRAFRPRWPVRAADPIEQPFLRIADVPGRTFKDEFTSGSRSFVAGKGDLPDLSRPSDVEAIVLNYWAESRMPVTSYDAVTGLVTTSLRSVYLMNEEFRPRWAKYYMDNVFEAFGTPGDWYHDRVEEAILYTPLEGETPATAEAFVPLLDRLIEIKGDPRMGNPVDGIEISDIIFEHCDWSHQPVPADLLPHSTIPEPETLSGGPQAAAHLPGVIGLIGAKNCKISRCIIRHVGFYGIELDRGSTRNEVSYNTLTDLGGGGIKLNGALFDGPVKLRTGNNVICDNTITSVGRIFHSSVGILVLHAHDNRIAHNEVSDLFYSAISVGWTWGYAPSASYNNVIEYNHLHHYGQRWLCDMGGIYLLGVSPGTVLRGNLIHDCQSAGYGGWGVYLDEGSSFVVVEDNLCFNFSGHPFNIHYGRENLLRNNLFAFGDDGVISHGKAAAGENAFNLYHNVLLTREKVPVYRSGYQGSVCDKNFSAELNLLVNSNGSPEGIASEAAWIEPQPRELSLEQWRATGRDRYSQLHASSQQWTAIELRKRRVPAVPEIGFRAIDLSNAGPRKVS